MTAKLKSKTCRRAQVYNRYEQLLIHVMALKNRQVWMRCMLNSLQPCYSLFTLIYKPTLQSQINATDFWFNILTPVIVVPRLHWHGQLRETAFLGTKATDCADVAAESVLLQRARQFVNTSRRGKERLRIVELDTNEWTKEWRRLYLSYIKKYSKLNYKEGNK